MVDILMLEDEAEPNLDLPLRRLMQEHNRILQIRMSDANLI